MIINYLHYLLNVLFLNVLLPIKNQLKQKLKDNTTTVYSQLFHFWLCADLYSAPTRRLRNLMLEVLFQFESEHSDRRIMYFDIDPPLRTNPPVYRRSHLFGRRRAFIFWTQTLCRPVYPPRCNISRAFVLRQSDCDAHR